MFGCLARTCFSDVVGSAGAGELNGGSYQMLFGSLGSVDVSGSGGCWWVGAPGMLLLAVLLNF